MDKNLSKPVKILILEYIALTARLFFKFNQQKRVGMVSTNKM